ncbi:hypothetical protein ASF36_23760 [Methylobacterium sp. Leaf90]|nr:hypothetical protein ASF36_23760 [Methylobacterium sp. Leaf90]
MAKDLHTILSVDASKRGITLASAINDRDAFGQLAMAEEYLVAAHVMADACDDEVRLIRPKYMLLCQSLELGLKSLLLGIGVSANDLNRKPLNHDLKLLVEKSADLLGPSEPFIGPEHQETIRDLAPAGAMFYFRYGHRDPGTFSALTSVRVPPFKDALEAARALLHVVRSKTLPR